MHDWFDIIYTLPGFETQDRGRNFHVFGHVNPNPCTSHTLLIPQVPRPSKLSWEVQATDEFFDMLLHGCAACTCAQQVSDLGVVSWRCPPVAAPGPRRRKRKEKEMDVAEAPLWLCSALTCSTPCYEFW